MNRVSYKVQRSENGLWVTIKKKSISVILDKPRFEISEFLISDCEKNDLFYPLNLNSISFSEKNLSARVINNKK